MIKELYFPTSQMSIANEYITRIKKLEDPIAIVVTNHLFTEYWLNRLMKERTKTPGIKNRKYSIKLNFAYKIGLIDKPLFNNLKKLNKLRNDLAHKLNYDISLADFDYTHNTNEKIEDMDYIERIRMIGIITFGSLNNHCVNELGLSTEIEEA